MTGYSEKELLGMGIEDLHPKQALPGVIKGFKDQVKGMRTLVVDVPLLRKDKKVIYCDINSAMINIHLISKKK